MCMSIQSSCDFSFYCEETFLETFFFVLLFGGWGGIELFFKQSSPSEASPSEEGKKKCQSVT